MLRSDAGLQVAAFALATFLATAAALAGPIPDGFVVVPSSISPDRKLGVLVPDVDHIVANQRQDALIELATGKVVAVIAADTIFEHQSNIEIHARWSSDGSMLLWYADGKWGSDAVVLVPVAHHVASQQIDARELAVQQTLAALRKAHPSAYAAAKLQGVGQGSWFRDGFAIDVHPEGDVALPMKLSITLTSNPKQLDDYPAAAQLTGAMTAVLQADGTLKAGALTTSTKRP